MISEEKSWKVGELANLTGITVRTLHHYDEYGLLTPSLYSNSGHRLYTEADIARLQQIMSLKQLGLSLSEIKELINNHNFLPGETIRIQLERVNEQIGTLENLRSLLESLYELISTKQDVTAEQLIKVIEVMRLSQKYFSEEQMEKIKKQGELLGPDKIREVENEWPVLIAKVREEMEKGTSPENPEVVQLAKRWRELINMFTGGDPEITKSAERYYAENQEMAAQMGINRDLYLYIKSAMSYI